MLQSADQRLAKHGLTSAQWAPLFRMHKQGGAGTVAALARDLQMGGSAMTRLLDRLESKGLCRRVRCTEDRRVVNVALTPEGAAAVAPVPAVLVAVLDGHLAGFSETDRRALKRYMLRMLENGEGLRNP